MGFFSKTIGAIGDIFEEGASAVGDVVESVGTSILGPAGTRGSTIGGVIGRQFGYEDIGSAIGSAFTADISAGQERLEGGGLRRALTADDVAGPVTQSDYDALQAVRDQRDFAEQQPEVIEGTVIDIRYPVQPRTAGFPDIYKDPRAIAIGAATGAGMEFLEQVGDYFFGEDDNAGAQTGMMMCRPQMPKAFNVNRQTGCITITRKQQAKLKEAVRMFGGPAVAKNLGISNQTLQNLLLKTFRARRKGISGADIRAVKRVDRQMHSLACALGGISQTSRAVSSRKSPPKRSC